MVRTPGLLQYQADYQCRSELFAEVNRKAYAEYTQALTDHRGQIPRNWPYNPVRPWNHVFTAVLSQKYADFWQKEFEHPALRLVMVRGGNARLTDVLGGDATVSLSAPPLSPAGLTVLGRGAG